MFSCFSWEFLAFPRILLFLEGSGGEIYTVFDEESESEVENLEILHPDLEIKENHQKIEILISPYLCFFLGGEFNNRR